MVRFCCTSSTTVVILWFLISQITLSRKWLANIQSKFRNSLVLFKVVPICCNSSSSKEDILHCSFLCFRISLFTKLDCVCATLETFTHNSKVVIHLLHEWVVIICRITILLYQYGNINVLHGYSCVCGCVELRG